MEQEVSGDRVPAGALVPGGTPRDPADPLPPLTAENVYERLSLAKTQGRADLKERCYAFMSDHFLAVLRTPAVYGRLTAGERERVLARRLGGRRRLAVAEVDEAHDRVLGGGGGGSRPPSRDNSRPQSPLDPQSPPESSPSPEDPPRHRRHIFCYEEQTKEWRALSALPEQVSTRGAGMCTLYNYLFVAGGLVRGGGGRASDRVFCYNPLTDAWSEARPLTQARSQLKLVAVDGHLFAVGGECLFTVERYDPRVDRWTPVAPLPRGAFAVAHEATACGGDLFVSGGSLFYRLLRLDARRGEWEECAFNDSRKKSTDMVAHGSSIYRFDVNRAHGSVNVCKYNTVVRAWHDGASHALDAARPFRCAVLGDRIYCVNRSHVLQFEVGGGDLRERFLPEVLDTPAGARGALVPFVLALGQSD